MNYILELNVEITIDKDNPSYILHHVETQSLDLPNGITKGIVLELMEIEYKFIEELLGFKPYLVTIEADGAKGSFYSE